MATRIAQPNVMMRCQLTLMPPIDTLLPSKNLRNASRLESLGHTQLASPIMNAKSATVTDSRTTSVVPWSPRITTRSVRTPKSGHNTKRVRTRAIGAGMSQSKRSCQ